MTPFGASSSGVGAPKLPHDADERGTHEGTKTGHSTFALQKSTVSAADRRRALQHLAPVN
jgi:hypothetical protein